MQTGVGKHRQLQCGGHVQRYIQTGILVITQRMMRPPQHMTTAPVHGHAGQLSCALRQVRRQACGVRTAQRLHGTYS